MKKLLLMLLCTSFAYAQLNIGTPNDIEVCDPNNDGIEIFDFSANTTAILSGLNPNEYTVTYHETFNDSDSGTNPIADILSYVNVDPYTQNIYARVVQTNTPTNYALASFTLKVNPTPITSPISHLFFDTDGVNDNIITLDLTAFNSQILNGLPPELYTITFYETLVDASLGTSNISDPTSYVTTTKTIYYRVANTMTSCFSTDEIDITVLPEGAQLNIGTPMSLTACAENFDAFAFFDLSVNNEVVLDGLDPDDYSVTYHISVVTAEAGNYPIQDITSYYTTATSIYVRVTQISTPVNYAVAPFQLIVNPRPAFSAITSIVVFDTDGVADNTTSIDLDSYRNAVLDNDAFTHVVSYYLTQSDALSGTAAIASPYTTTTTTIYYRIETANSCISTRSIEIVVLPEDYETEQPTGATTQTFTEGETLADIEIDGENIQWYNTPGETTGLPFTPKNNDTPLPLTTLLVNNTTYYASQTIHNIESTDRLAVTVSTTMGMEEKAFTTLQYYPNPVNDVLTLTNSSNIEMLTVTNMLGQTIITKQINNTNTQLDLSSLNNGVYFVKVSAEGKNKTLKIIKE